jgi:hypothetical protein
MLATIKFVTIVLFFVLTTSKVVSVSDYYKFKGDDRFTEYCCNCIEKGWFGECISSHSGTCREAAKLVGHNPCPKGTWGCYTDRENPVM